MAGIIRLAHALGIAGPLWQAAEAFLADQLRTTEVAVLTGWMALAEELEIVSAWAVGVW